MERWTFGEMVVAVSVISACTSGAASGSSDSVNQDTSEETASGDAGSRDDGSRPGDSASADAESRPDSEQSEADAGRIQPVEESANAPPTQAGDAGSSEGVHGSVIYLGALDADNTALRGFFYRDLSQPKAVLLHEGTSTGKLHCSESRSACVFTTRQFDGLAYDELYHARFAPDSAPEITPLLAPEGTSPEDPLAGVFNIDFAEVSADGSQVLVHFVIDEQEHAGIFHVSAEEAPAYEALELNDGDRESVSVLASTPNFERLVLGVGSSPRRLLVVDRTGPTASIWDAGDLHGGIVDLMTTRDCQHMLYFSNQSELGIEYFNLTQPGLPPQSIDGASHWLSPDQKRVAYSSFDRTFVATFGDGPLESVPVPLPPETFHATDAGTKVDFSLDGQGLAIRAANATLDDGNLQQRLWYSDLSGGLPAVAVDVSSAGPHGFIDVEEFYFAHDGGALCYTAGSEDREFIVSVADGKIGTPSALFSPILEGFVQADAPRLPESHFPLRVLENVTTGEALVQLARVERGMVTAEYEEFKGGPLSVHTTWHGTTVLVSSSATADDATLRVTRLDLDGETPALHLLAEHPGITAAADMQLSWDRSAAYYAAVGEEGVEPVVAFNSGDRVRVGGEEFMALSAFLF